MAGWAAQLWGEPGEGGNRQTPTQESVSPSQSLNLWQGGDSDTGTHATSGNNTCLPPLKWPRLLADACS